MYFTAGKCDEFNVFRVDLKSNKWYNYIMLLKDYAPGICAEGKTGGKKHAKQKRNQSKL